MKQVKRAERKGSIVWSQSDWISYDLAERRVKSAGIASWTEIALDPIIIMETFIKPRLKLEMKLELKI